MSLRRLATPNPAVRLIASRSWMTQPDATSCRSISNRASCSGVMLEGGALRSLLDSLETQYRVGSKVAYEIHQLVALQCCQATSPFHSRTTLRSEHYDHYSMRNDERSQKFVVVFYKTQILSYINSPATVLQASAIGLGSTSELSCRPCEYRPARMPSQKRVRTRRNHIALCRTW